MKAIEIVSVIPSNQQFSIIEANTNVCKAVTSIDKVMASTDANYIHFINAVLNQEVIDVQIAPIYKNGEITHDRELQIVVSSK